MEVMVLFRLVIAQCVKERALFWLLCPQGDVKHVEVMVVFQLGCAELVAGLDGHIH